MMMEHSRPITVLVVEDKFLVRKIALELLEELGCLTEEASNADEAMLILEANRGVSVLFSDIEMSRSINGLDLASIVIRRWPEIHILLTSGRMPDILPDRVGFLQKPYNKAALSSAMTAMTQK